MVIFGLKQYHKEPPPHHLVAKIVTILKDVSQIDLCFDISHAPNIEALSKTFDLHRYKQSDTFYINQTGVLMLDRVTIYNKALKNALGYPLWRIEATMSIPNSKLLALPLNEFKQIIDTARSKQ